MGNCDDVKSVLVPEDESWQSYVPRTAKCASVCRKAQEPPDLIEFIVERVWKAAMLVNKTGDSAIHRAVGGAEMDKYRLVRYRYALGMRRRVR